MKRFVIIAGPNGAGKTTLAKEFLKELRLEFMNADEMAADISKGKKDIKEFRIKAGRRFIKKLNEILGKGRSVAVESTLSGSYLLRMIEKIRKHSYKVSIIYVFVDNPRISINRIKARVDAGGHHVPDEDVIRRFYRSKNNFWKLYKNVADEWTLFYNGIERPVLVAGGSKSEYELMDKALFGMFRKDENDK